MKNNLLSKLKKGLLYLSIPILSGCALNSNLPEDDLYYSKNEKTIYVNETKKDTISKRNDTIFYDLNFYEKNEVDIKDYWRTRFIYSPYSSSLGLDNDGDGILNFNDPWRNKFGPYIDMNDNGVIDFEDWQIAGFNNNLINDWWFYFDLNNPLFWDNYYWSTWNYYVPNYIYYFDYHETFRENNRRQRTLTTKVLEKNEVPRSIREEKKEYVRKRVETKTTNYKRPERVNTENQRITNTRTNQTRNTNTNIIRQNTRTNSNSGNSNSNSKSTRSSGSERNSNSSKNNSGTRRR